MGLVASDGMQREREVPRSTGHTDGVPLVLVRVRGLFAQGSERVPLVL